MATANQTRVILVTGANKGIGFELVKKFVNESSTNNNTILLGSRDLERGQNAFVRLNSPSNVHVLQLDASSEDSIVHAANEIKQKYGGQLDVLVNNAAILNQEVTVEAARKTFHTNYFGIKMVNQYMFPLIRENGRVINVSSQMGTWALYEISSDLRDKYLSPTLTIGQLDHLVESFIGAIETQSLEKSGYNIKIPCLIYSMSKAAVNALTRIQAHQWSDAKNILILSVTPGYCATDMNYHPLDARPAELGAESILFGINTPHYRLKNGAFYEDGEQIQECCANPLSMSKIQQHMKEQNQTQHQ